MQSNVENLKQEKDNLTAKILEKAKEKIENKTMYEKLKENKLKIKHQLEQNNLEISEYTKKIAEIEKDIKKYPNSNISLLDKTIYLNLPTKYNIQKPNHHHSESYLDKTLSEESEFTFSSGDFSTLKRQISQEFKNKDHHHSESYLDKTLSKELDNFQQDKKLKELDKVKINLENKNYSLETNCSISSKSDIYKSSILDLKLDKNKYQQSKEMITEQAKKMGAIPKGKKNNFKSNWKWM